MLRIGAVAALAALAAGCATTTPRVNAEGPSTGRVDISCLIGADGGFNDCRIEREEPAGAGFGEAALSAARQARLRPREDQGGGRVRFTMRFSEAD